MAPARGLASPGRRRRRPAAGRGGAARAATVAAAVALAACGASRQVAASRGIADDFSAPRLEVAFVQTAPTLRVAAELQRHGSGVARRALREEMILQAGASRAGGLEVSPIGQGDLLLNTVIFIGFCVPFLYAAWEFWRRIAFGQQFGTGEDNVVFPKPGEEQQPLIISEAAGSKPRRIGKEDKITIGMDPDTNRGRRVLGQDALGFAYFLMFLAAACVGVALVAVYPVFSGQVGVAS